MNFKFINIIPLGREGYFLRVGIVTIIKLTNLAKR